MTPQHVDNGVFSLTIKGFVIASISLISKTLDLDFDEGQVTEVVEAVFLIGGMAAIYIGRVRRGDITWYGKRIVPVVE